MSATGNLVQCPSSSPYPADDSATAAHEPLELVTHPPQPSHFVQFYEDETSLLELAGRFLSAGLQAGDRLLIIATQEHYDAFMRRLEPMGALRSSRITFVDAHQALSTFMVDGAPDAVRFRDLLARVLPKAAEGSRHAGLRAYGEMVDLLWQSGNSEAAIRLEELWNDLGKEHIFSLLCAYTMGNFYREGDGSRIEIDEVRRRHTHVLPSDRFARQRELEKELVHREELEESLRAALRRRTQAEEELRTCLEREREARTEAEEAVKFRELFVGMLGHDLRNPLNTILNTARIMLMRGEAIPEGRARLERLIASGTRMQRMIEQILDLTRERLAGGIPVDRSWRDLEPIVSKIVTDVRAAHPAHEITYSKRGDCRACVDEDRFEQVVANLLGNAIDHGAPEGPIEVALSGSDRAVQIGVRNYGRPIDPRFMPYLFDPFARTEKTQGRSEGLGLGLYIVDRIIKAHEGTIHASSSVETGTVFEATIPKHERGRCG